MAIDEFKINKKDLRILNELKDDLFCNNIILSKNIKVGLKYNNNFLFLGNTGEGILSSVFFSNIVNIEGGAIVIDRDCYLYDLTSGYLKSKGFEIEILDFENTKESLCLDLFRYFETKEDISNFIEYMMPNTFGFNKHFVSSLFFFIKKYLDKYKENYSIYDFYSIIQDKNIDKIFEGICKENELLEEYSSMKKDWGEDVFKSTLKDCELFFKYNLELLELGNNNKDMKVSVESLFFEKKIIFVESNIFKYRKYIDYFLDYFFDKLNYYSLKIRNLMDFNKKIEIFIPEFYDYQFMPNIMRLLNLRNYHLKFILSLEALEQINIPTYTLKNFVDCFDVIVLYKQPMKLNFVLNYCNKDTIISNYNYSEMINMKDKSFILLLNTRDDKYIYSDDSINCFKDNFYKKIIFSKDKY